MPKPKGTALKPGKTAAPEKKTYLYVLDPLLVVLVCGLFFFTSLDNKVFDLYLRLLPPLKEDDKVLTITVDDGSVEQVGIFPWTRDILADAIVFLREMGAKTVVFDLSYLDNSPVLVDSVYVREELPRYLESGFRRINDTTGDVMDAFANGVLGRKDVPLMKEEIIAFNNSVKDELAVSVDYVTRDVDAHFADTLTFFGSSYLTLTMLSKESIIEDDKTYAMDSTVQQWIEDHLALKNIDSRGDTLTPDNAGIVPAIHKLLSRARGAGFVNANPDKDGYRRRIHLLLKHNGFYYPHLSLAALNETLGISGIAVDKKAVTLKNATIGGVTRDIRIPRASDGTILLKWPKKSFYNYNIMSAWDLIRYNRIEANMAYNLGQMNELGFFLYGEIGEETPLDAYNNANYIKELLYAGENEEEGIRFDTYLEYRARYLAVTDAWLNGPAEAAILAGVEDEETRQYVQDFFAAVREDFSWLIKCRREVSAQAEGAFCIIGATMTSSTDLGLTTFQTNYPNVGTYPVMVNMILSGDFLDDAPQWVSLAIAAALSLMLAAVIKSLDTGKSVLAGLSAIAACAALSAAFFFLTRRYVGTIVPLTSVTLTFLSLTGINFFTTLREKSFLRSAFSRYLAPSVIEQIIADPDKLNLGGEKREMTAIFTDIQRFSSISEALQTQYAAEGPKMLVDLLNLYLTEMSNIVLENEGTIDKFEGDAIIAFFGAPIYTEKHASLACRAAIQMKKAEAALREKIMDREGPFYTPLGRLIEAKTIPAGRPLYTRIGVNTGDMVVGNMGTPSKMDYTIMGNAVNLAARLEGVNKQYYTGGILISEYTRGKLGDEFALRPLSRVRVVGINTPFRLYELLDTRAEAPAPLLEAAARWERALGLYEEGAFGEAAAAFAAVAGNDGEDKAALFYRGRCETYAAGGPPPDFPVDNLTEK
ncbi:MAG: CHASE2 domain-containing protein [Treponema sp.]|jgi:adenylate cyclase|nr:CHASE2 domain-containing protein [Treponema sp.]